MARLFVAVRPPPEVVALLSRLDRPALPGVRWPGRLHVSSSMPGICRPDDWQGGGGRGMIEAPDDRLEVAMRNRREPAAPPDDDDRKLISLQDKHDADRLLQEALAAGEMDVEEFKRRRGKVYAAVTPRELWKATGHRAGSRERADKPEIWRSVRLQLAIVAFAAVIMVFVLLGTILNAQGGTVDTPIFPWEWGDAGD